MLAKLKKITLFDVIVTLLMTIVLIITMYPFLQVVAISFNDATDTVRGGIHIIPRKFTFQNYISIFESNSKLITGFINSVLRTVIGTIAGVLCTTMLAYTLSRTDYMFRKPISVLFVLTMYVSGGLIPEYMVIRNLGLINKFSVYVWPMLINAFNVIVLRSFMDNLPFELQESAKIDGANDLVIFWKIIFPLCMPAIATVALFVAVGQWNSWFDTYLYAKKDYLTTLQYELMKVLDNAAAGVKAADINTQGLKKVTTNPESIKMAITVITTVPIVCVYPFLQRYFVSGMTVGAVKS
ncbi:carbohydrate ABC transporter permease [Cellulosilyticum lentocellum]|uniref:ABC-type transporter, integral membrane subunit n=1 Tax=Cellulosilyticum lentocellum (strain ATCC 49066 / DSM 5427 / NCIMB 11756 / RHM5) TaxID=642492 RepID=F2JRD4_CELLD|nr:carbohydrate ABC transporter permease [Cellulosilyticum lentocellum]ADZ82743.1 ABC-type transporter, integral membrane subunit [Cellulosilyticum lentocellum DSM 5427]